MRFMLLLYHHHSLLDTKSNKNMWMYVEWSEGRSVAADPFEQVEKAF